MARSTNTTELINAIANARNRLAVLNIKVNESDSAKAPIVEELFHLEAIALDLRPQSAIDAFEKLKWIVLEVEYIKASDSFFETLRDLETLIRPN